MQKTLMQKTQRIEEIKLSNVLRDNTAHPLIIIGKFSLNNTPVITLSADINVRELHTPAAWQSALDAASAAGEACLLIKDLDSVAFAEQKHFMSLLKDRRAGSYKLPASARIIITAASETRIAPEIKSVALLWKI